MSAHHQPNIASTSSASVSSPYLNTAQAAQYLTISVRHLKNLLAGRRIKAARIGRRLVFKRSELDRYVDLLLAQSA